jgi:hypothetical protein
MWVVWAGQAAMAVGRGQFRTMRLLHLAAAPEAGDVPYRDEHGPGLPDRVREFRQRHRTRLLCARLVRHESFGLDMTMNSVGRVCIR